MAGDVAEGGCLGESRAEEVEVVSVVSREWDVMLGLAEDSRVRDSSAGRSIRPREGEDSARGAAAESRGVSARECEAVVVDTLLPLKWPEASRLVLRSSGKREVRVERRVKDDF